MEVTKLSSQIKNPDRINIFLNNKYEFSLDISQVIDLAVKPGNIYSDEEVVALRREGEFSKYYTKAMVYSLARHDPREKSAIICIDKLVQKLIWLRVNVAKELEWHQNYLNVL